MATINTEFPDTSFSPDNGATSAAELKDRIGSRVQSMILAAESATRFKSAS